MLAGGARAPLAGGVAAAAAAAAVTPMIRASALSGVAAAPGSAVPSTDALFRGMDADQIRMMAEECIVVDADDNIVGHDSKKNCHLNGEMATSEPPLKSSSY